MKTNYKDSDKEDGLREGRFPSVFADDVVLDHEGGGVDLPVVDPLRAVDQVGLVKLEFVAFRWSGLVEQRRSVEVPEEKGFRYFRQF